MSLLVSLPAILAILATVAYGDELQITPKTPDEFLSYMQARGFMQIDEIIDEKSCISFKFYITHDSTQKCLRHRCTDNVVLSDFDCKLWNQEWNKSLTRRVRNHISTSKSAPAKGNGEAKESIIEIFTVKPDTCTTYTKIRSVKNTIECWRRNCKDAFSVRIQCKLFDGVKPANRHTVFKKRRHHGKI
uniref:Secreted protein n=1 Tax=Caenorhabditis tropicalis TaxID=1561998 RepID=A0A1I7TRU1_9PELO